MTKGSRVTIGVIESFCYLSGFRASPATGAADHKPQATTIAGGISPRTSYSGRASRPLSCPITKRTAHNVSRSEESSPIIQFHVP